MKKYYDLHVFYTRDDGYSTGVAVETDKDELTDSEVIEIALKQNIIDDVDARHVDRVTEIAEVDYNILTDNDE